MRQPMTHMLCTTTVIARYLNAKTYRDIDRHIYIRTYTHTCTYVHIHTHTYT